MTELPQKETYEEVRDIIENIPNTFNKWILGGVIFILSGFFIIGFFVEYPDVINTNILIKAKKPPIKLVSTTSGNLRILKERGQVDKGEYIGYLENVSEFEDVMIMRTAMLHLDPESDTLNYKQLGFKQSLNLGELEQFYYAFIDAYYSYYNNKISNKYDLRISSLNNAKTNYSNVIKFRIRLLTTKENEHEILKKKVNADSVLFARGAILEFDLNDTRLGYFRLQGEKNNILLTLANDSLNLSKVDTEITNLTIEKKENSEKARISMKNSYRMLIAKINDWERKYVFKSPISGKLEYLDFWENRQFISAGEIVYSILPDDNEFVGYVYMPSIGAGKVEHGQDVNIKLESYPYHEFGILKGKVSSISLIPNEKIYLNLIELPDNLTSNFGKKLNFSAEMEGTAEIITDNKKLIERLYSKLKYLFSE